MSEPSPEELQRRSSEQQQKSSSEQQQSEQQQKKEENYSYSGEQEQKYSQEEAQKTETQLPEAQPQTGVRYAGVWRAGSGQQVLVTDADWSTFEAKWRDLSG